MKKSSIYLSFIKVGMQETTVYRINWFFRIVGNLIGCIVSVFVWNAAYRSSESSIVNGFTSSQMMVYLCVAFLTSTITYSNTIYRIGDEIKTGAIACRLLKPVDYRLALLFQEIGNKILTTYLIVLPIIFVVEFLRTLATDNIQFDVACFFCYLISCVFAYMISFLFNMCFGLLGFFTKNIWGVNMIKNTVISFLSGAVIPLSFFPKAFEKIIWCFPFASLNYIPTMIYLNVYNVYALWFYLGLQLFWIGVLWFGSNCLWKVALKQLCVQGG